MGQAVTIDFNQSSSVSLTSLKKGVKLWNNDIFTKWSYGKFWSFKTIIIAVYVYDLVDSVFGMPF